MSALWIRPPVDVITEPGLYDMTAERYHADPVMQPSLSSSTAVTLLEQSPRHAWAEHPRLGVAVETEEDDEDEARKPSRDMEIGSVVHALLLGKGGDIVQIDAKDYKRTAAKEERANAHANGKLPILTPDLKRCERIVAAAREQMADSASPGDLFNMPGWSELVLAWKDQAGPWCRSMFDLLIIQNGRALIVDIKTSGTAVNPVGPGLGYKLADMGYEMRAAFYERGLVHLMPELAGRVSFWHVWIETKPPYCLTVTEMDGAARTIGGKKAAAAIGLWHRCLSGGVEARHWPRYAPGLHRIEYPGRAESNWIEREVSDPVIGEIINADPFIGSGLLHPRPIGAPRAEVDNLMGG